ncbi:MAG: DUF177 domain-containing protein [Desulfobacterales bacterium]|nr:DUF177 domain-containing protein [Desulfobacterales bacterium]
MANLFVEVHDIPPQGLDLEFREPVQRFPVIGELTKDGNICFSGPVIASLRIAPEKGLFLVQGRVEIESEISCCRCLAPFRQPLAEAFALTYTVGLSEVDRFDPAKDAVVDLTVEDMGLALVRNGRIDLLEVIQEAVVMALPMRPLCREDCKGLCPNCGADLNRDKCTCAGAPLDPRLAVLAKLKIPERE